MPSPSGAGVACTVLRYCLSTLPFFVVLVYLLYNAYDRANENPNDGPNDDPFSLMDTMIVFLAFHVVWTVSAIHLLVFVPKRRYLLDRYLREGESTLGDVVVLDESARRRRIWKFFRFPYYGHAIYSHPTKPMVVRKKVRVYQHFTRERITILRLPNRPLSGQAKVDIEIKLTQMRHERDTTLCYLSTFGVLWLLFALAGAAYCVYQMQTIEEFGLLVGNEDPEWARKIFLLVVGINPFVCFLFNGIRYFFYYNWMVKKGMTIQDETDARKVQLTNWCLYDDKKEALSFDDDSDQIPYSILGEDRSYAGTVPSHSRSLVSARPNETVDGTTNIPVSSIEENGEALRVLPWANP